MHATVNPSWALTSAHASQWMAFAFALGLTATQMGQILVKSSRKPPGASTLSPQLGSSHLPDAIVAPRPCGKAPPVHLAAFPALFSASSGAPCS